MRRIHRVLVLVSLLAVGPVLAGCSNFDPDSLDVFGLNEKKKLPGERKELFPGGVPGVTQGIPPEYRKGYQPAPDVAPTAEGATGEAKTAAVQPAEEEKPKAKPKPKPKPRVVSRPTRLNVGVPATRQAPAQSQPQQQPASAPWPDQQPQQQQPARSPWPAPSQQSSTAPWPSAPPPGTFSKQ